MKQKAIKSICLTGALVGMVWMTTGCGTVPLQQQRLVSKPNMVFSDSPVYAFPSGLLAQVEPGTASSGGAQVAGCTACQ